MTPDIANRIKTHIESKIQHWMIESPGYTDADGHPQDDRYLALVAADSVTDACRILRDNATVTSSKETQDLTVRDCLVDSNTFGIPAEASGEHPWKVWRLTVAQAERAENDLQYVYDNAGTPDSAYVGVIPFTGAPKQARDYLWVVSTKTTDGHTRLLIADCDSPVDAYKIGLRATIEHGILWCKEVHSTDQSPLLVAVMQSNGKQDSGSSQLSEPRDVPWNLHAIPRGAESQPVKQLMRHVLKRAPLATVGADVKGDVAALEIGWQNQQQLITNMVASVRADLAKPPRTRQPKKSVEPKGAVVTEEFKPFAITGFEKADLALDDGEDRDVVLYGEDTIAVLRQARPDSARYIVRVLAVANPTAECAAQIGDEGEFSLYTSELENGAKSEITVGSNGGIDWIGHGYFPVCTSHLQQEQPAAQHNNKDNGDMNMAKNEDKNISSVLTDAMKANAVQGATIAACDEAVEIARVQLARAARASTNPIVGGMLADAIDSRAGTVAIGMTLGVALPFLAPHIPNERAKALALRASNTLQQQAFGTAFRVLYQKLAKPLIEHFVSAAASLPEEWGVIEVAPQALVDGVKTNATASAKKVVAEKP